jgi:hypothetical protein
MTAAISAALAAAQAEMHNPTFDAVNPHFKSKFASLKEVAKVARAALAKHDIFVGQQITGEGSLIYCTTVFHHKSGESLAFGPTPFPVPRNDPQGYGSATTYARRYSLSAALCLVGDDDDDGNAAVDGVKKAEQQAADLRRKHLDSVTFIKDAIAEGRIEDAALAWFELPDEAKQALWIAPTKGGLFSTEERALRKTSEFRKAGKGEAA